MARRRYLSTEVSLDTRLNAVAVIYGDFAALLYSWLIPHAGDDAVIPSDPERIRLQVFPGRSDLELGNIEEAMARLISAGLLEWTVGGKLRFPLASFYRYQTYIKPANRSSEERQESAGNAASFPLSLPVSPSPSNRKKPSNRKALLPDPEGFKEFWEAYPRRVDRPAAIKAWRKLDPDAELREKILAGLKLYALHVEGKDSEYVKHPGPWINARRWEDDTPTIGLDPRAPVKVRVINSTTGEGV